jgi:cbb3-type cytochrome oxidase cytochrome c subunit
VLTTVLRIVDRGDLGSGDGPDILARLRPAVNHLMHVWMPGAHVPDSMMPFWRALERRSGFTRQWDATVARIRDQLAMRMLTAFYEAVPVPQR